MDVHLRELAAGQRDLVAAWQLLRAGWTRAMVDQRVRDHRWRAIHSGVYALTQAPLTREQSRMAATLTAPDSFLSHASAGAHYGIRAYGGSFEVVTRVGNGGPRKIGDVLVCRSKELETTIHNGIPITTPERTLIDLAAHGHPGRMLREALRLGLTTPRLLAVSLEKHRGRRGTRELHALNDRYSTIPYARTRSNAEAKALEVLLDAGVERPCVNLRIAGEEADLAWPARRLIIEIDGPQYHRFADEDARKQRVWEAVGYTVRCIQSDLVYDAPQQLIALVNAA